MIEWKRGKTENVVAMRRLWWSINDTRHKWQISGPKVLWQVFTVKNWNEKISYIMSLFCYTSTNYAGAQTFRAGYSKQMMATGRSHIWPFPCWYMLDQPPNRKYLKWLIISANKSKWGFDLLSLSPKKKDCICFLITTGCELQEPFLSSSTSYKQIRFQHPRVRHNCPVRTDSNKIKRQRFLSLLWWPSHRFTTQTPKITYNLPRKIPTYQEDDRKGSE